MRVGLVIVGQSGVTWEQWCALADACEQHGIDTLFSSDHYLSRRDETGEFSHDAWTLIAALAARTTTLRLGTLVTPVTFRSPALLANVVATADHVSGGRVELGIGAGWHEREHEAYGFEFPPTPVRIDVLEEQLQVVVGEWAGAGFSFDGQHYRLRDLDALPKPVQTPHPPLIIGGSGGRRSAALAARYADEYNTAFPSPEQVVDRRRQIADACERTGREPIPFSVMTAVIVGSDERDLQHRMERFADRIGGDAEQLLAQPPPAWVVGTVDTAAEQLAALEAAGVSRVMCQHLPHDDLEFVALLGEELAPRVR